MFKFKKGHHLDQVLLELKDSTLVKMNESFVLGGDDILRYQDRLCVPDGDNLQTVPWFQIFDTSRFHKDVS